MKLIKEYTGMIISGLLGAIFCFIIFGDIINFSHVNWIYSTYADTFQHYMGWEFFRTSPWTFPLGIISNLGYPIGIPITYTDSIPLLAIPLKLINNWLPKTFQYLGLWILLCYILQGIFGYKLSNLIFKNRLLSVLASIFFIVSPIMLYRAGMHTSLTSHFLILVSLYLVLRPHQKFQTTQWGSIMCLALLIHPYFLFMLSPLWLADLFILLKDKNISIHKIFCQIILIIFLIILLAYLIGLFYIGAAAGGGYGSFSMNLNSIFNPQNYSRLLPNLTLQNQQDESFTYLGLGVITLFFTSLIIILKQKKSLVKICIYKWWPLFISLLILMLVATSNQIYFGQFKIVTIPLPTSLNELLEIIRASGRLFWPVYYVIILFSLTGLRYIKYKYTIILLILFLALQIFDLSNAMFNKREIFSNTNWTSSLQSPIWKTLPQKYNHISFIPNFNIPFQNYVSLDIFAIENSFTVNQGYFARMIKGGGIHVKNQIDDLKQGIVDPQTIYVFSYNPLDYLPATNTNPTYKLLDVDGLHLLLPNQNK